MAENGFILRYLFEAELADGSVIAQTPADISIHDPSRSAFYDVMQRLDEVRRFTLRGAGRAVIVDLRDGHFEFEGLTTWVGDFDQITDSTPLRLIYFRRHQKDFNLGYDQIAHRTRYFVGWQATVNGKNVRAVVGLD